MPTPRYHINIFYSAEDRAFIADIPDLGFCSAFGPTPQDALREVLIAQRGWLRSLRRHGRPIPKPRYRAPESSETRKPKKISQLTPADLRRLTKDLDREFISDFSRPLRPSERAAWNRAKRKPARSGRK